MSKLSRRTFLASLLAAPIVAKVLPVPEVVAPVAKLVDYAPNPSMMGVKGLGYLVKNSGVYQDVHRSSFTGETPKQ